MSSASLVAYTQIHPPYFKDYTADHPNFFKSLEDIIVYVARVSNPASQKAGKKTNLIKYLADHNHWSPFEMVDVILEIKTTRDIGRQILRHRSFFFQEFSQRYADPTENFNGDWYELREPRLQDLSNRQNSIPTDNKALHAEWEQRQDNFVDGAEILYKWAIENGIAKEQARAVLPEGMTKSVMFMKGSLRSWIHYIELRSGPETQLEHRIIAQQAADAIKPIFSNIGNYCHG